MSKVCVYCDENIDSEFESNRPEPTCESCHEISGECSFCNQIYPFDDMDHIDGFGNDHLFCDACLIMYKEDNNSFFLCTRCEDVFPCEQLLGSFECKNCFFSYKDDDDSETETGAAQSNINESHSEPKKKNMKLKRSRDEDFEQDNTPSNKKVKK
jgi:hypothetical protein